MRRLSLLVSACVCLLLSLSFFPVFVRGISLPPAPTSFITPRQASSLLDARSAAPQLSFHLVSGIIGSVRYAPTYDSPSIRNDLNGVRISLPKDTPADELGGCADPASYSTTDDVGLPIAGTVLLLIGGACSVEAQFNTVRHLGAVAWINTFTDEGDELYTAFGANSPDGPSLAAGYNASYTTPYILVSYYDGLLLSSWLRNNAAAFPYVPLLANISGAGTIDPLEAQRVRDVYTAVNVTSGLLYPGWIGDCNDGSCGYQRPFSDVMLNPQIDSCQNRVGAFWCVGGRVVALFLKAADYLAGKDVTSVWNQIGQLSQLSLLNVGFTTVDSLSDDLCNLSQLGILAAYGTGATRIPSCFASWPRLFYMRLDGNALTHFPAGAFDGSCQGLTYLRLTGHANNVGYVPAGWLNAAHTPNLGALRLSNINLTTPLPDFRGFQYLARIQMGGNSLYADPNVAPTIQALYLDNQPVLFDLQLQNNNLAMPLPLLQNVTSLSSLSLSNNHFSGRVPSTWQGLSSLTSLVASNNAIESPVNSLGSLPLLVTIDLSYNSLTSILMPPTVMAQFDTWLAQSFGTATTKLLLSHNSLTGSMPGSIYLPVSLKTLDLSYNQIGQFGASFFGIGSLVTLDMSHNPTLTGGLPDNDPPTSLSFLSVAANTQMSQPSLPSYLTTDYVNQVKASGTAFICAGITGASSPILINVEPSLFNYQFCTCDSSYFGTVPNCISIPDAATPGMDPFLPLSMVTPDLTQFGTPSGTPINSPLALDTASMLAYATNTTLSLTDASYGSARLLTGLNTRWLLSSSVILGAAQAANTRVVQLVLYVNTLYFNQNTDVLTVQAGDLNATRTQFDFLLRGDDSATIAAGIAEAQALGPIATAHFGAANTALFRPTVLDSNAVVQFQSRATANQHFRADFFFASVCPPLYDPNPLYVAGGSQPSCISTPTCDASLVQWRISPCDESVLTQQVQYGYTSNCLAGSYNLPDTEAISCAYAPVANGGTLALIVIISILCAATAFAVLFAFTARKLRELVISRLLGEFFYSATAGLVALSCTYFGTVGELTPVTCATRLHLLLGGFALLGTSLAVSMWKRRQQLELPFFNPNSVPLQRKLLTIVFGSLVVNIVLIDIGQQVSVSDEFELQRATWTLSGGAVVPLAVCPQPSLWLSIVLVLINLVWLIPALVLSFQVLWLAILSRDRLGVQLAQAKAQYKKNASQKQKQKASQLLSSVKAALLTVVQAQSAMATLWIALAGVIIVLVLSVWHHPAESSQAIGIVLILTGIGALAALFSFSIYYFVRRDAALNSQLRALNNAQTNEVAAQLTDSEDAEKVGSGPEMSKNSGGESRNSSALSFSHTRAASSSEDSTNEARQTDGWSAMMREPSAASLFDASNTNRSSFDSVVNVILDPVALRHLYKFAQTSFQADSILFIMRVQEFIRLRNSPAGSQLTSVGTPMNAAVAAMAPLPINSYGRILTDLRDIFTKSVKPGAEDEINVSNDVRDRVKAAIIDLHTSAVRMLLGEADVPLSSPNPAEKDVLHYKVTPGASTAAATSSPKASSVAPKLVTVQAAAAAAASPNDSLSVDVVGRWQPVRSLPASPSRGIGNRPLLRTISSTDVPVSLSAWSSDEFESELVRVSGGSLRPSVLSTVAPASFIVAAMELWKNSVVEMIHLTAHNTWQRFQDSKEAQAANSQLHFCEHFDEMPADEQKAVLQRIRLQFGEQMGAEEDTVARTMVPGTRADSLATITVRR